jgi:hypothetical protein
MKSLKQIPVLILLSAVVAIGAQDNPPPKKKVTNNSNGTPREHSTPPARQEHQAAPAQQHAPQPAQQHPVSSPQEHQGRPHSTTVTPQTPQPTPANRTIQSTPGNHAPVQASPGGNSQQPGRTFGRQSTGAQPATIAPSRNDRPDRPAVDRGGFGGSRTSINPGPARVVRTPGGGMVQHNDAGRVTEVRTPSGAMIHHAPDGVRRVEMVRPDGRVIVSSGSGHGYVQRQVIVNNTTIVKRTYVVRGVSYVNVYRPVTYRGVVLHVYTPVRYYRPAFYAYAYSPWSRPVYYTWGWRRDPWFMYYGDYFAPYPVYASPTLWLTDYLVASTLEAAYRERMAEASMGNAYANNYQQGGQVGLTPEVKQAIADEVRRQVDQERAQGQNPNAGMSASDMPPMFADNSPHVFVAHASLEVNSNAGGCIIGEGDVLQMTGAPPSGGTTAEVVVLASRGRDCRKGAVASVQLQDLQEMQNHMRETIDRGLGDLQSKQGQDGFPALPSGAAGTVDTQWAGAAQPDAGATSELSQVTREADRAERDVLSQSQNAASGPVTISLGQSIDEVKMVQGEPEKIVDLGSKKIYVYKDLKITFIDGKVSTVE